MSMRSPVRKVLLRKITWMGGDRRLVGVSGLTLFCIAWTMFYGFGFSYGLPIIIPFIFWAAILWVARAINLSDPYMVDVVLRQFKYRKYYAPKSDVGVEHPQVRDFV